MPYQINQNSTPKRAIIPSFRLPYRSFFPFPPKKSKLGIKSMKKQIGNSHVRGLKKKKKPKSRIKDIRE